MSSSLYFSILRPAILHILRAAGFHGARTSAVDSLTDIAARYLAMLAEKTAEHSWANHQDTAPTITDLRMALEDIGAFYPDSISADEQIQYDDDTRGIDTFLSWMDGDTHKEIRRIAGLEATAGEVGNLVAEGEREDYLTALKKKHSKTGEESKFQGTALGKPATDRPIKVEGGFAESIKLWQQTLRSANGHSNHIDGDVSMASSPLSEAYEIRMDIS